METCSDMTRPQGRLLKASSVKDIPVRKMIPENTMRYKVYKYIQTSKKPLLQREIHQAVAPTSPKRVIEVILADLANQGIVNREKCFCGCSFIYTK